ncbi:MAG: ABC transporter ATP-binding protein [Dehalococcoidia bacterium]
MTALVEFENVEKSYGGEIALRGISFEVERGECISLLGPSGCGKTTTLRCLAGLEQVSGGTIRIGSQVVSSVAGSVAPGQRGLGMVFQSFALWPHMTVLDNVAYPLRRQGLRRAEARERAAEPLSMVGLAGFEGRYPGQLSGGQQQRVAVARAICPQPELLLFDEPLSNLDAQLRERMRFELRELQQNLGFTAVYVTHDQAEAMVLSDRIILMSDGQIVQSDRPETLYRHPATEFAAGFLGNVNVVKARVEERREGGTLLARSALGQHQVVGRAAEQVGDLVQLAIRAQYVEVTRDAPPGAVAGKVEDVIFLGDSVEYRVGVGDVSVVAVASRPSGLVIGDTCSVLALADGITCLGAPTTAGRSELSESPAH